MKSFQLVNTYILSPFFSPSFPPPSFLFNKIE